MIGGELLARFRLVVDYAHSRILFEPERDLRRRFEYDMSGLILFAEGPGLNVYVVRFVLPNSPAAEAGLQVGDSISTVDGKAVSQLRISTIAALLSKTGRTHRLEVERDGHKIRMKLTPRPLV
jgi:C-terminal processing protease CtpA/Prc